MYEIETKSKDMIADAVRYGATDVHLIPVTDGCYIQYRIRGDTSQQEKLDHRIAERLVSHFKYQSGMDIGEKRKPQSASMKINLDQSTYDLRISTLPTRMTESLAIRILHPKRFQTLSELPLFQKHLTRLKTVARFRQGLCLITGPTGSGKTTTLYALLEQIIYEKKRSIITIEDPVERLIEETIQVEINLKAGLTYASSLRAALRHDPDVIMVGEIRDRETALLAVRAALTGHFVIATLHSSDCYQAVLRMIEFGVSELDFSEACRAIFSQRLVLKICPFCKGVSTDCYNHLNHGRSALYEWFCQELVKHVMVTGIRPSYSSLSREARKAWSLGFISTVSLEGFDTT